MKLYNEHYENVPPCDRVQIIRYRCVVSGSVQLSTSQQRLLNLIHAYTSSLSITLYSEWVKQSTLKVNNTTYLRDYAEVLRMYAQQASQTLYVCNVNTIELEPYENGFWEVFQAIVTELMSYTIEAPKDDCLRFYLSNLGADLLHIRQSIDLPED